MYLHPEPTTSPIYNPPPYLSPSNIDTPFPPPPPQQGPIIIRVGHLKSGSLTLCPTCGK